MRRALRVLLETVTLGAALAALVWPASAQVKPDQKVREGPTVKGKVQEMRPIEVWLNGRPFARGHPHATSADPDARLGVDQTCIRGRDAVRALGGEQFVRWSGANLDVVQVGTARGAPLRVLRTGWITGRVHRMEGAPTGARDREMEYIPLADLVAALGARVEMPRPGVFDLVIDPEDRKGRPRTGSRPILGPNTP